MGEKGKRANISYMQFAVTTVFEKTLTCNFTGVGNRKIVITEMDGGCRMEDVNLIPTKNFVSIKFQKKARALFPFPTPPPHLQIFTCKFVDHIVQLL